MARVPRPRKSGQTGGSRYNEVNRSAHASARVYQKASKKSGCLSIIIVAVFIVTGAGFSVASLLL